MKQSTKLEATNRTHFPDGPRKSLPDLMGTLRMQMCALGVFWICIGLLCAVLAALTSPGSNGLAARAGSNSESTSNILMGLSATWFFVGTMTCLQQVWAVYLGMGLSFLVLLSQLKRMNIWTVLIETAVVYYAYKTIRTAKELAALREEEGIVDNG